MGKARCLWKENRPRQSLFCGAQRTNCELDRPTHRPLLSLSPGLRAPCLAHAQLSAQGNSVQEKVNIVELGFQRLHFRCGWACPQGRTLPCFCRDWAHGHPRVRVPHPGLCLRACVPPAN